MCIRDRRRGWVEIETVGPLAGQMRRVAPFNFDMARRAVMLNGATQVALTKIDMLFPECAGARSFDELSASAREFVLKVERALGVPVSLVGTGPGAEEMVDRRYELNLKED